jgi:hypothetical protein
MKTMVSMAVSVWGVSLKEKEGRLAYEFKRVDHLLIEPDVPVSSPTP